MIKDSVRKIFPKHSVQVSPLLLISIMLLSLKSLAFVFLIYNLDVVPDNVFLLVILYVYRYLPPIILICSIALLFSGKGQNYYLIISHIFISILLFIDIVFFRAFAKFPSIQDASSALYTPDLSATIIGLMHWHDILWVIDILLIILISIRFSKHKNSRNLLVMVVCMTISLTSMLGYLTEDDKVCDQKNLIGTLSPIGYHLYDLKSNYTHSEIELTSSQVESVQNFFETNSKLTMNEAEQDEYFSRLAGKNIIIIQVESLENVMIGKEYNGTEITPNLNQLVDKGYYFDHIYEQVGSGNSADAEFLLNTSIYPLKNGSAFVRHPNNTYLTLPNLFQEDGYRTVAVHGDDAEFWNRENVYPKLGYDEFISEEMFSSHEVIGLGQSDRILFEEALECVADLSNDDEPYFLSLITTTSHAPFELPDENNVLSIQSEDNNIVTDYYQTISYVDTWLGYFIKELESSNVMKDTAIVIYGDHEGIHKYYPKQIGERIQDNNLGIPLIVYCPEIFENGKNIDTIGGQIDLYPTIAHLWGITPSRYSNHIMGSNLLDKEDYVILMNGSTLGEGADSSWLNEAREVADLVIKSDYFGKYESNELLDRNIAAAQD